jgi:hypothetical protein
MDHVILRDFKYNKKMSETILSTVSLNTTYHRSQVRIRAACKMTGQKDLRSLSNFLEENIIEDIVPGISKLGFVGEGHDPSIFPVDGDYEIDLSDDSIDISVRSINLRAPITPITRDAQNSDAGRELYVGHHIAMPSQGQVKSDYLRLASCEKKENHPNLFIF